MKIVADDQLPLIEELFSDAILIKKPGEKIQRADLMDADMLWVRTVTSVNASLLQGTAVRFVGTATAGYDHLETDWLEKQGIVWAHAPGANAMAVAEYVLCVVASLRTLGQLQNGPLRAGVIGVGRVGRVVADYLSRIGFQVILNDPPRAQCDPAFHSAPLSTFVDLDLICLHAALTTAGEYPSYHLLGHDFLQRQKPGAVLLNAARGALLETPVLLRQSHLQLCLDVWENEPDINLTLLQKATIATPHIAAYSVAAKRRASLLLYQQAQKFFDLPIKKEGLTAIAPLQWTGWEKRALEIFDPLEYTKKMHNVLLTGDAAQTAKKFLHLRKEYPWRDSFLQ